ncbi:MAG: cobyrinate a,c-diamide synthase [Bacillota bacterium]|nr:cobyrinate a,c-diamide synthase [Bacillota bacterium]
MAKSAFVLAATQSNSGKTTIAMGLMTAFRNMGLKVQPFKVGPDYIDPMYHTAATGRNSRNLDSFMLEEDTIRYLFEKNSADADIAIVEGVMGLYDGQGGFSLKGSSAHIAQILDLPVILVVNGNGMSLSVAALIKGFQDFSPETKIGGVILNQVKNDSGYLHLKEIIETNCKIPVLGYLPKNEAFALSDRHLGLYCSEEIVDLDKKFSLIAESLADHCDLNQIRDVMARAPHVAPAPLLPGKIDGNVTIGYAKDSAFNFYYRDSLDLLEELGATLVEFSPMTDKALPSLDGVILGGGYPELHLEELSANRPFMEDLKVKLENGLPCFAECGGFIYLGKSMTMEGKTHELTGFFPFDFAMTDRLQHFGYMEAAIEDGTILTTEGSESIRGHEFHYTKRTDETAFPASYRVTKKRRTKEVHWEEGYHQNNVLGGYPHFNFYSNPQCAKNLLLMAQEYQRRD